MDLCTSTFRGFVICVLQIYEVASFLDKAKQFPYVELRLLHLEIQFTPKFCLNNCCAEGLQMSGFSLVMSQARRTEMKGSWQSWQVAVMTQFV